MARETKGTMENPEIRQYKVRPYRAGDAEANRAYWQAKSEAEARASRKNPYGDLECCVLCGKKVNAKTARYVWVNVCTSDWFPPGTTQEEIRKMNDGPRWEPIGPDCHRQHKID